MNEQPAYHQVVSAEKWLHALTSVIVRKADMKSFGFSMMLVMAYYAIAANDALAAQHNQFDAAVPRARQVALAMSAAPPEISHDATIYVLGPHGFERARTGSNGFSCLVDRNIQNGIAMSLEPKCFDAEGTRTLLPVSLRIEALRAQGRSEAQIDADITEGYHSGRFIAPRKPGLIYMMSPYNVLARGPNNTNFGHVAGHLMFYAPYMTLRDLGYRSPKGMLPVLADPGTPYAMMIVVPKRQL